MIIINLTNVLGIEYFELNIESDYLWKNETNESRFLYLDNKEYEKLIEIIKSLKKEHHFIINDTQAGETDYLNLYLQDYKIKQDHVELHFHV